MHPFYILTLILSLHLSSIVARHAPPKSQQFNNGYGDQGVDSDSNEVPNNDDMTTTSTYDDQYGNGQNHHESRTSEGVYPEESRTTVWEYIDQYPDEDQTTTEKINYRRRRSIDDLISDMEDQILGTDDIGEKGKSEEDSKMDDLVAAAFINTTDLIDSAEDVNISSSSNESQIEFLIYDGISGVNGSSKETYLNYSISNGTASDLDGLTSDVSFNESIDTSTEPMDKISVLKQKITSWQNAVDNYLSSAGETRRRRSLSQLFPSTDSKDDASTQGKGSIKESVNSLTGQGVNEALKPAMDLMAQGVQLLSDLYSTQLRKSNAYSSEKANSTETANVDQFRVQLGQLQHRLGDLGMQLQRVVNTFQNMHFPFMDTAALAQIFASNDHVGERALDDGQDMDKQEG